MFQITNQLLLSYPHILMLVGVIMYIYIYTYEDSLCENHPTLGLQNHVVVVFFNSWGTHGKQLTDASSSFVYS